MITDAQYLAWLQGDTGKRVTLVEAEGYDGVSVKTFYFSSSDFSSKPTDTPANINYVDDLQEVPRFTINMSEAFGGKSTPGYGDILVDNSSGEKDEWLEYAWIGYPIRLYLGDISWDRNDFRLILDGVIANLTVKDSRTITFKVRDKQDLLNKQVQSNLFTSGSAIGKPIPLTYGEVFQISPVLIDSATHKYKIHDGPIEDVVQVYSDGIAVAFTEDLANGEFTLSSAATGTITADAKGAKISGTYITKVADIAQELALKAGLTGTDIDSTSVSSMNTKCPQKIGLYIDTRTNLLTVLDDLIKSVGGWYGFGRNGKLQFGRLDEPTGTSSLVLIADDIESYGVDVDTIIQPVKTIRLGYKKFWTTNSNPSSSVSESFRADLLQEFRVVTADNSVPFWPLAEEPDMIETLLVDSTEAQAEADRRAALNDEPRKILRIRATTAPQSIEIGQEVNVQYPRFGLDAGLDAIVVGVVDSPTSNRVELKVWL